MKKTGIALTLLACLLFSLAGCGKTKSRYKDAEELLEASSFAQAEALLSSLGDFKDAAEKLRECKYLLAKDCVSAQPPDVVRAVRLLEELGNYRDAIALKESLLDEYFFAEYGRRIPVPVCIMTEAKQTDDTGKDKSGAFHRYTYTWSLSGNSAMDLSDQFGQWLDYIDGVDGLDAEPYRNGTYYLGVDGDRLGVVSSQKNDTSVSVSVVLYESAIM